MGIALFSRPFMSTGNIKVIMRRMLSTSGIIKEERLNEQQIISRKLSWNCSPLLAASTNEYLLNFTEKT